MARFFNRDEVISLLSEKLALPIETVKGMLPENVVDYAGLADWFEQQKQTTATASETAASDLQAYTATPQ
jgi:hypothetical protein